MKKITASQARFAMDHREFDDGILRSGKSVVVVCTQDWCPQWRQMKEWIGEASKTAGTELFVLEYNTEKFFEEFLEMKENVWGNREIPYLRYYAGAVLVHETNYVSRERFLSLVKTRDAGS